MTCATRAAGRDRVRWSSRVPRRADPGRKRSGVRREQAAVIGVAEHSNAAVLVTVASGGVLLDRREVTFTDPGVPTHPHHHEGSWAVGRYLNSPGARRLTLAEAVSLVGHVRASAVQRARVSLEALAAAVQVPIAGAAIRACPALPPTTEERITDHHAQMVADSVMYREALAEAARTRGWRVWWYDREHVLLDAEAVADGDAIDGSLRRMGQSAGPPWQARHRLAAAAALAALGGRLRNDRRPDPRR